MVVTDNAQFVFAAVNRPQYYLKAIERTVEICKALALTPADPFLLPYRSACEQAVDLPQASDFLQVSEFFASVVSRWLVSTCYSAVLSVFLLRPAKFSIGDLILSTQFATFETYNSLSNLCVDVCSWQPHAFPACCVPASMWRMFRS